ncbi:helix-turn-helix domain-containing protein [Gordonia sp. VNQ95]|jgi:AraC-like DNA-binding protein|uniref:AraC family transcriptional regulator n=1 Tax=Gordonia TaxID=2053 RepID=UPI0032B3884D
MSENASADAAGGTDEPEGRGRSAIIGSVGAEPLQITRHRPTPDLAPWLDYVWIVRWAVDTPVVQQVIPQPVVHLAAEGGRLNVNGVGDLHFSRTLAGRGHTVGIAFRPGGFRAFSNAPVSALTRSVVPLETVLGVDDRPIAATLLDPERGDTDLVDAACDWLERLGPRADPVIGEVGALVDAAEHNQDLTRAEHLAALAGVSLRTLQRQFGDYVGIGPKWVIQRFRMLDVAAVANAGGAIDWADTAVRLGFSDQAHLTRAFTRIVGISPAAYSRNR